MIRRGETRHGYMEVPNTIPPALTEGQDRLCMSPAIMNGACLHCQMDARAETPTLSTAQGGKSKRFISAHASQFRSGQHVMYHPGAESKLLSWSLYRVYHLGMAGLPAQPYGCWDEWAQLCPYLTCLCWGFYGQSWWVLPASSSISAQKGEQIVAVKSARLPGTTQALSKGPVFPLLQPERKFSRGTTLSSKCSKLFSRPTWPTLQHRELKAARGIKVP